MSHRSDRSVAVIDEDQKSRWDFVKKVSLIVLVQLMFTILNVFIVVGVPILRNFHADHAILILVPIGIFLIVALSFGFFFELRHTEPYNYISMVTYTIALTYVLLFAASNSHLDKITFSTAIAALACALIFLVALKGGCDCTVCNPLIITATLMLLVLGVLYAIFRNIIILLATGCFGILVFMFYLLFHNQLILVNKCKYAFHTDEHLSAAMAVYSDIVGITFFLSLTVEAAFQIAAEEEKK